MAKKIYAVKVGRTNGIFETWDECKASVNGYPGALYKSFTNMADAYAYLNLESKQMSLFDMPADDSVDDSDFPVIKESVEDDDKPFSNSVKAVAYVDGSYNIATKHFSYGCVIFYNGEEFHLSKDFDDPELASMRNVSGEIFGSMAAMDFAIEHGIKHIAIYHDYAGIEKWCTGDWRANKPGTIAYKKYYEQAKKKVDITFCKVKGHSGDKYNDLADMLAKKACGID